MDFFAAQDSARRSTTLLVFYFLLAVVSLVVLTNLLVMAVFAFESIPNNQGGFQFKESFDWGRFWIISIAVLSVVSIGSIYKIMSLASGGGARVAEALGASLVVAGSRDFEKQRLYNVVEEMAIASGTPMPQVYVMEDEPGINAFAAGFESGDAVVAVTAGTLENLSRDQLQGVIAHEFSHILNGDMRLNIRLIGVLHGILIIGLIGYFLLRSMGRGRSSSRNNGQAAMVFLGLGLMIIGYSGTFFGNLIKAAVSRQREFLADASAVQFTRNPEGIAGALKQIGASNFGSKIQAPGASEISHAYFSEGLSGFFNTLFATHPPLEKRIRCIDPHWNGKFVLAKTTHRPEPDSSEQAAAKTPAGASTMDAHTLAGILGAATLATIGQPRPAHIAYARNMLATLPPVLLQSLEEPYGARAVVYFLVLDKRDPEIRSKQLQHINDFGDKGIAAIIEHIDKEVKDLPLHFRLPILSLATGTLRQLSAQQYDLFKQNLNSLVEMDKKISLFEWSLQRILFRGLDRAFGRRRNVRAKYERFQPLAQECRLLLSLIAHTSGPNESSAIRAFTAASTELGLDALSLIPKQEIKLATLDQALDRLDMLKMIPKSQLLRACTKAITVDNKTTVAEAELFRAIAATLDVPVPPMLATLSERK